MNEIILVEMVQEKIYLIRGQRVMLDSDLAKLYMVETFNLNKAVKRNIERFPEDFMFQLTKEESDSLRFQIGILKTAGRSAGKVDNFCLRHSLFDIHHSSLKKKQRISNVE